MGVKNYSYGDIVRALVAGACSETESDANFATAALYYFENEASEIDRENIRRAVNLVATALTNCGVVTAMELVYKIGGFMNKFNVTGRTLRNEVVEYADQRSKEEHRTTYRKQGRVYR